MVIIYKNFIELTSQILHTKFQGNRPSGSEEEDFFKVFTIIIWAWRPSRSRDLDEIYKLSFPLCLEATYEI